MVFSQRHLYSTMVTVLMCRYESQAVSTHECARIPVEYYHVKTTGDFNPRSVEQAQSTQAQCRYLQDVSVAFAAESVVAA
jgi:hypothetical protein